LRPFFASGEDEAERGGRSNGADSGTIQVVDCSIGNPPRGGGGQLARCAMSDKVYSVTEIVGSSQASIDDAIHNAVATASRSLRNLDWFEVTQVRGHIENGKVAHFQVGLKIGFRYETKHGSP
jgi:flavin-binding protein dodecin